MAVDSKTNSSEDLPSLVQSQSLNPVPIYSPPQSNNVEPMVGEEQKKDGKLMLESQRKEFEALSKAQCSNAIGIHTPSLNEFNDYIDIVCTLIAQKKIAWIKSIKIIYEANRIYGIAVTYKYRKCKGLIDHGVITTKHFVPAIVKDKLSKSYKLKKGEYITGINGKYKEGIVGLQVITNKGVVLDVGSVLGHDFSLNVPDNSIIVAFAGGVQEYLCNIAVYYIRSIENA